MSHDICARNTGDSSISDCFVVCVSSRAPGGQYSSQCAHDDATVFVSTLPWCCSHRLTEWDRGAEAVGCQRCDGKGLAASGPTHPRGRGRSSPSPSSPRVGTAATRQEAGLALSRVMSRTYAGGTRPSAWCRRQQPTCATWPNPISNIIGPASGDR